MTDHEEYNIIRQLEDIAADICRNYCKYPELWDEEIMGCELAESEICKQCPLNRL